MVIGANRYSDGRGKAYVYLGSPSGLVANIPAWTAMGENTHNSFGSSVASAGDVNDDGYADVVIGAFGNNSLRGKAYVYHGSPAGLKQPVPPSTNPVADWTASGENSYDLFGYSVASAGDVNGDGYTDVIIGTYSDIYISGQGKAYVYHGSPAGLGAAVIAVLLARRHCLHRHGVGGEQEPLDLVGV